MCSCGCAVEGSINPATCLLDNQLEDGTGTVEPTAISTSSICALDLDVRSRGEGLVTAVAGQCTPALCRRLAELGIRPGAMISVHQKTAGNGRIVACGPSRYALDCALCSAIMVEPVSA
ncbi:MAG: FeoA family protein [Corynebacterium sp.]|nr:FeoA family protein [Corynebacterium sp.]